MRRGVILIGLVVLFLVVGASASTELTTLFQHISPSVGALYAHSSGGDLNYLCSATAIGREGKMTVVLTAWHCVKKDVAYMVSFDGRRLTPAHVWKGPHYEMAPKESPREFNEPETDMALFLTEANDVPVISTGTDADVKVGDRIATVGFPLGVAKISYEGIVAGRYNRPGADQHNYLLLQIFGAPGSSGSAIIDQRTKKIIGVLVGARQQAGLPVIFATPISYQAWLLPVKKSRKNVASP